MSEDYFRLANLVKCKPRFDSFDDLFRSTWIINISPRLFLRPYYELLHNIKDELLQHIIKHYRRKILIGYLIGGVMRIDFPIEDNIFLTRSKIKRKYRWRFVHYFYDEDNNLIRAYIIDFDEVEFLIRRVMHGNKEILFDDFFGLIEFKYPRFKGEVHTLAPNIVKFIDIIDRFDYYSLRWYKLPINRYQRYRLFKSVGWVTGRDLVLALWKAQSISQRAITFVNHNARLLIELFEGAE